MEILSLIPPNWKNTADAGAKKLWPRLAGVVLVTTMAAGCHTTKPNQPGKNTGSNQDVTPPAFDTNVFTITPPRTGRPTITYIGDTCFIKFAPGKPIVIPIKGMDLYPNRMSWSVSVDGVAPATQGQDFEFFTFTDSPTNLLVSLENAAIVLSSNYTSQIKSGDTITVSAEIVNTSDQSLRDMLGSIQSAAVQANELLAETKAASFSANLETAMDNNNRLMAQSYSFAPRVSTNLSLIDSYLQTAKSDRSSDSARKKLASIPQIYKRTADSLVASALNNNRFPVITSGFRSFKVFSSDDFRTKFLSTRLDLSDIKAFPMTDEQAQDLFGAHFAQHFYVVLFSAVNNTDTERLINTGMINAYGRALVWNGDKNANSPVYSIPIQVSPESLQQVYSDLAGTKWNTTREWFFRSLEFAGSVASAYAVGYRGTPDLIKGLSLATGTVIPGGKILWPDQYPDFLANIVNYGMPELVKIPAKSSVGFKLLFFSKDTLKTIVSDPGMYSKFSPDGDHYNYTPPETQVVYLSFDTLEVPYEGASISNQISSTLTASVTPPYLGLQSGQKATFGVNVSGTPPFSFLWYYNNKPDTNQTTAQYTINAVSTNNIGSYSVQVTDGNKASYLTPPALLQVH